MLWAGEDGGGQLGQLFQLRLHGGLIDLGGFVEQVRLAARQGLALLAETEPFMTRQLQGQRLDFDLSGVEGLLRAGQFGAQPLQLTGGVFRRRNGGSERGRHGRRRWRG